MAEDNDTTPDAIVIDLTTRLPMIADDDEQPSLTSSRHDRCFHRGHTTVIHVHQRQLICSGCDTDLDPYEYINRLAKDGDDLVHTRKRLKALRRVLNELLSEEKRLKSRVRAWRKKAEVC
jgi:hypothetical protein